MFFLFFSPMVTRACLNVLLIVNSGELLGHPLHSAQPLIVSCSKSSREIELGVPAVALGIH